MLKIMGNFRKQRCTLSYRTNYKDQLLQYSDISESFVGSIGLLSNFLSNQSLSSAPKSVRLNITYTVDQAVAIIATEILSNEIDFEKDYKFILERFISRTDKQHTCPASFTKDQRAIGHKLVHNLVGHNVT